MRDKKNAYLFFNRCLAKVSRDLNHFHLVFFYQILFSFKKEHYDRPKINVFLSIDLDKQYNVHIY
jgi:hypothetical protein